MPHIYDCADHPDFQATALDGAIIHAGSHHPGTDASVLIARGVMGQRFTSQRAAQGGQNTRIMGCRSCGRRFSTTDDARPPRCDDCLPVGAGA